MSTIKLLDTERFTSNLKEVTTPDIFISKGSYHPDGLFSESIFGPLDTDSRKKTFSYISLNTRIIHPALIPIVKRISRPIIEAILRKDHFKINEEGYLVRDKNGNIFGLSSVLTNFDKIKFRGGTPDRDNIIDMLKKYIKIGRFFIDKIVVMPPAYRDVSVDTYGKAQLDEINKYYVTILNLASQLKTIRVGVVYDVLSASMQNKVLELYEFIVSKISKKEGLIRSGILSKRVDYSARGVVVGAGYELKSNEIGVPFRLAVKLYEPFILYELLNNKNNSIDRKRLSEELYNYGKYELSVTSLRTILSGIYKGNELPETLNEIIRIATELAIRGKVVIAKRDPVLHSESVLAFYPVLVDGSSIKLNPLFCDGYNADFDGDQMALFVPITDESIQECKEKMIIVNSKTGILKPILSFSKDSIAGLYSLTKEPAITPKEYPLLKDERNLEEFDIYKGVTYDRVKTTIGRVIFNLRCLPSNYPFVNEAIDKKKFQSILKDLYTRYDTDTFRKCCDSFLQIGFKYYMLSPPTFSIEDLKIPKHLYALKEKLKGATPEEAQKVINQMEKELAEYLRKTDTGLSILAQSGTTKGGFGQLRQVLVAKGLIADVEGNILPPFSSSYADGLSSKDFFNLSPGTRKGIVNRALNTATTGYLSRQLVYALQNVEIDDRIKDCKTNRTLDIVVKPDMKDKLLGRYIVTPSGSLRLYNPSTDVGKLIHLRSPMYCQTKKLCLTCYGHLALKNRTPYVGIIAATVLGERGTQLIMRTFHTGGSVSLQTINLISDITEFYTEDRKKLFSSYFKQVENSLQALVSGKISIRLQEYLDENNDIHTENLPKSLGLDYAYMYIHVGNVTFDVALDYTTTINTLNGIEKREDSIYIIDFKEGDTVFTCKPQSTDFTKLVKIVEATLSGRKAWKNADHWLLKLYKQYVTYAESDSDFVHFEVVASNLLRDKENTRIPARLNRKKYNPTLVNIKTIPALTSWLTSLEFERFNYSIEKALIYPRPEDETVLERLMTGNI